MSVAGMERLRPTKLEKENRPSTKEDAQQPVQDTYNHDSWDVLDMAIVSTVLGD